MRYFHFTNAYEYDFGHALIRLMTDSFSAMRFFIRNREKYEIRASSRYSRIYDHNYCDGGHNIMIFISCITYLYTLIWRVSKKPGSTWTSLLLEGGCVEIRFVKNQFIILIKYTILRWLESKIADHRLRWWPKIPTLATTGLSLSYCILDCAIIRLHLTGASWGFAAVRRVASHAT